MIRMPQRRSVQGLTGVVSLGEGKVVTQQRDRGHADSATDDGLAAWDLVDMDRYRAVWMKAHGYFSLNMAASRGCSVSLCLVREAYLGQSISAAKCGRVAAEMAHLKRTFDPDHIWFADDIFGFRVDWVAEFAAAAAGRGRREFRSPYKHARTWSASAWPKRCAMPAAGKHGSAPRAAANGCWTQ